MAEVVTDFYAGYEGEPAIRFRVRGEGQEKAVRLWAGDFDALMSEIEPEPSGWTGLALPYHLDAGWYESSPWRIPDIASVIHQWMTIDAKALGSDYAAAHAAVLNLLLEARRSGDDVFVEYE